jgi:ethanolamine utilization protein EutA
VADRLGIRLELGDLLDPAAARRLASELADCLVAIIGREQLTPLAEELLITPALSYRGPIDALTFSGGVSEFIYEREERDFGDLARPLADAVRARIRDARMPAPLQATDERIRATVIGASQFTVQVSGNTISVTRPELLPVRNLQVVYPLLAEDEDPQADLVESSLRRGFQRLDLEEGDGAVAIAINWNGVPRYLALRNLAEGIVRALPKTLAAGLPIVLVFSNDFGSLVGQILQQEFGVTNDIVSVDTVQLQEFDYVDIGEIIEPAHVVPIVVKSLVFPQAHPRKAELIET